MKSNIGSLNGCIHWSLEKVLTVHLQLGSQGDIISYAGLLRLDCVLAWSRVHYNHFWTKNTMKIIKTVLDTSHHDSHVLYGKVFLRPKFYKNDTFWGRMSKYNTHCNSILFKLYTSILFTPIDILDLCILQINILNNNELQTWKIRLIPPFFVTGYP